MKLSHLFALSAAAMVPAGALAADPQVDLRTNLGTILLELYPAKAPKTGESFRQIVREARYTGGVLPGVFRGFISRGGGIPPHMKEKRPRAPIPIESKNG